MIYRLPQVRRSGGDRPADTKWVEAVTAVVVLKASRTLSEDALIAHCSTHMAAFQAPSA